jgi:hypothetical protein
MAALAVGKEKLGQDALTLVQLLGTIQRQSSLLTSSPIPLNATI